MCVETLGGRVIKYSDKIYTVKSIKNGCEQERLNLGKEMNKANSKTS